MNLNLMSLFHFIVSAYIDNLYSLISEKEMAPHSSTLAWKIPWTEEPGGLQVHGVAKSRT